MRSADQKQKKITSVHLANSLRRAMVAKPSATTNASLLAAMLAPRELAIPSN
jgi:hypothetical protein